MYRVLKKPASIRSYFTLIQLSNLLSSLFHKGALERKAYRDKQGGPRFTVKEPDTEEEIIEEEPKKKEEFYNVCDETKKDKPKKKSRSKSKDKKPKNQKPKSQIAWKGDELIHIFQISTVSQISIIGSSTSTYSIIYIF